MTTQQETEDQLFEKGLRKIFSRIDGMIANGEEGFASYFVAGHDLHDRQDRIVAEHYGLNTDKPHDFVAISTDIGTLLLNRTITFSSSRSEKAEDDSSLQTGVQYTLHLPDII